jgi:hypothetical protein
MNALTGKVFLITGHINLCVLPVRAFISIENNESRNNTNLVEVSYHITTLSLTAMPWEGAGGRWSLTLPANKFKSKSCNYEKIIGFAHE